jgi:hypothetical protein
MGHGTLCDPYGKGRILFKFRSLVSGELFRRTDFTSSWISILLDIRCAYDSMLKQKQMKDDPKQKMALLELSKLQKQLIEYQTRRENFRPSPFHVR